MLNVKAATRKYAKNISFSLKDNLMTLTLIVIAALGILAGGVVVRHLEIEQTESLMSMISGFEDARLAQGFGDTFLSSFAASSVFLIILFIMGFCALGPPIIAFAVFFKGLGIGLVSSYLFDVYGSGASAYFSIILLPNIFFSTALILAASKTSLKLSLIIFKFMAPYSGRSRAVMEPRAYCSKYMLFFIFAAVLSILDAAINILLLPNFPLA